jgi:hypothetical protein
MTPPLTGDTLPADNRFDVGTPQHLVELTISSRFSTAVAHNPLKPQETRVYV